MNNKMKVATGMMFVTVLIGGGAAVTPQQGARIEVTTHQRPHHAQRTTSRAIGGGCPSGIPVFDNVAHPIVMPACDEYVPWLLDVDGDGNPEDADYVSANSWEGSSPGVRTYHIRGSNPPELVSEIYLDVSPDFIQYEGMEELFAVAESYSIQTTGFMDVTNDGKPEAIVTVGIATANDNFYGSFYIENISEWPAKCATDINDDGTVNVTDLLSVMSTWGPCE